MQTPITIPSWLLESVCWSPATGLLEKLAPFTQDTSIKSPASRRFDNNVTLMLTKDSFEVIAVATFDVDFTVDPRELLATPGNGVALLASVVNSAEELVPIAMAV